MTRLDQFIPLLRWDADTQRERLLDAALRADRAVPGSAEQVVDGLPARVQAELRGVMELARALSACTQTVAPSARFRHMSRQRLLAAMTEQAAWPTPEPRGRLRAPAAPLVVT